MKTEYPRWCATCGRRMEVAAPNQKYCSPECVNRAKSRRGHIARGTPISSCFIPIERQCSRAGGRDCAYWVPLSSGTGSAARFCGHLLITGQSNGWKDPCENFKPGKPISRTSQLKFTGRKQAAANEALVDGYEAENAYKRG